MKVGEAGPGGLAGLDQVDTAGTPHLEVHSERTVGEGEGGLTYQNITAHRRLTVSLYLAPSGETLQLVVTLASPLLLAGQVGGAPVVSGHSEGVAE